MVSSIYNNKISVLIQRNNLQVALLVGKRDTRYLQCVYYHQGPPHPLRRHLIPPRSSNSRLSHLSFDHSQSFPQPK